MNVTEKKATLDAFARKLSGVVTKYQCFGLYGIDGPHCKTCTIRKRCKAETPKGVKPI